MSKSPFADAAVFGVDFGKTRFDVMAADKSGKPLRRAKLASCVSSCVLSMALDSADSPTADCGRTMRRAIYRTLASSRARASACA